MKTKTHIPKNLKPSPIIKKYSLKEAKAIVIKAMNDFHNGRKTDISDWEFDSLVGMLQENNSSFNPYEYLKLDGDSEDFYHDEDIYREYTKEADIEKIDTEEKFNRLLKKWIISPKFDGSSIVAYYDKKGNLETIATRGDDTKGKTQTAKLKNKIDNKVEKGIRCSFAECMVALEDTPKDLVNRNLANGLINSKSKQDVVNKILTPIVWDYLYYDGTRKPNTEIAITDYKTFCDVRDNGTIKRFNKTYLCDGIVLYNKDFSKEKLDIHKIYASSFAETELIEIERLTQDNSGKIVPKAIYKPVELDGTKCQRATLFNFEHIKKEQYFIGSKLKIMRKNATIPIIAEHEKDKKKSELYIKNLTCPECNGDIDWFGVDIICTNPSCNWWYNFVYNRIISVVSDKKIKKALENVDSSDFKLIRKAISVENLVKIFKNCENLVEIYKIPRLSNANKEKIIDNYTAKKTISGNIKEFYNVATDILNSELSSQYLEYYNVHLYNWLKNYSQGVKI